MTYQALEKLINLHDGYRQVFLVRGQKMLLIQEKGRRYLIQADCPHSEWPLQNAHISGDVITCGKHGWEFSLISGQGVNQRAFGCRMKCYKLVYEENTLGVLV